MTNEQGTVYVLHFNRPFKHARHYVGWAKNPEARIEHHRQGTGARLMQVVREAGIDFVVANLMPGTRSDERRWKNRGSAARYCSICKAEKAAA